jgi:hypothetical protein
MEADALQHAIKELANLEYRPPNTAAWINAVEAAPAQVIAGAIVMWGAVGTVVMGAPDLMAPRREAAMAILQARFAAQASRQTRQLLWLTWVIAALTGAMLAATAVQLLMPTPTHAELMSMPPPKWRALERVPRGFYFLAGVLSGMTGTLMQMYR